jgi:hypothetical protein
MGAIWNLIQREPVLIGQIVTAVIALAVAFGLNLTPEEKAGIILLAGLIITLLSRAQVTPNVKLPPAS